MIIPCIDLMDGKVVQLVQGREKALEGDSPERMLERFAAFPLIQVIDLDAAIGRGSNDSLVRLVVSRARCRAGGGVRGGQVYGASDRHAAYPVDNPVSPVDLIATLYHQLGVPEGLELHDTLGRPLVICPGRPIHQLIS